MERGTGNLKHEDKYVVKLTTHFREIHTLKKQLQIEQRKELTPEEVEITNQTSFLK